MLIFQDQERWEQLPVDERNRIHEACGAWHEELVKTGQSVNCMALQPVSTATTFYERNGKSMITDGPFPETKEFLGGLEVFECRDLDEAMAIVKRFPGLPFIHCVELRPVAPFGQCRD